MVVDRTSNGVTTISGMSHGPSSNIVSVEAFLVSLKVGAGLADSTRKVDRVGYTVVRVRDRSGEEGVGITYNEVGGEAIRELINSSIAPALVGSSPFATEDAFNRLLPHLRGVGRKGLTYCALSAVDIAIWDLKAKLMGLSMALLLGSERDVVDVYASGGWTSLSDRALVDEARAMVDAGYSKIKIKVGVEGGTNPRRDLRRVAAVREAVGADVDIMLDANNCWTSATASRFANLVREYDILFFEEPVIADDLPGLARFRAATDVPLATGEHEYSRFGARDLIASGAVDVLQLDMTRAGGMTEMVKVVSIAQAWNLPIAPHAMDIFHLPLVAAYPNALFLERLLVFDELTEAVFVDPPRPVDGKMAVPDRPGFGLTLNERALEKLAG